MSNVPPGWYVDPSNNSMVRWFDGVNWTSYAQPRQVEPTRRPPEVARSQQSPAPQQFRRGQPSTSQEGQSAQQPEVAPQRTASGSAEKIGVLNGKRRALELQSELEELRGWIRQNGLDGALSAKQVERQTLDRIESAEEQHRARIGALNDELEELQKSLELVRTSLKDEQSRLIDIRADAEVQDLGIFDFKHPAESSTLLSSELEQVRARYKSMVRTNSATRTVTGMTFDNSAKKGERFLKNMSKLLLRAYNAEAENAVKAAKTGNLESCVKRLEKAREQVERNGEMINLHIEQEYHRLRLMELELANRHLKAKEREKELDRAHRAELREQKKAEAEFKAKRADLLKEQKHYQNLVETLRARNDSEGLRRVLNQLREVEDSIADVDFRAANTRAGYVYVISNIGSFGENVVKIGMTRRLEPMDRVRELGDASVPFGFDVHALFFSDDAVGIETKLHQRFSRQRINQINLRREYFAVTPQQVLEALQTEKVELVEYTLEAPAEQYRQSLAMASGRDGSDVETGV